MPKQERLIIQNLLTAMERGERVGCVEHLDCWEESPEVWYGAISAARKYLFEAARLEEEPEPEEGEVKVPFHCPACKRPAGKIEVSMGGMLIHFWHKPCGTLLGLQLLGIPQQAQPLIQTPSLSPQGGGNPFLKGPGR